MKTLISFQYPTVHRDIFEPMCDFLTLDGSVANEEGELPERVYDMLNESMKPILLDVSKCDSAHAAKVINYVQLELGFDFLLPPTDEDPDLNVVNIHEYLKYDCEVIGYWQGERRHIKQIVKLVKTVGMPFNRPRMQYLLQGYLPDTHFIGFCSLDELRRFKPKSIHCWEPFIYAQYGIDIRDRERRPKIEAKLDYDLRLSDAQLEIAVSNCRAIQEALNG